MDGIHEPTLLTTDWNDEWMKLQTARGKADDPSEWDKRAATFPVKHGSHSHYSDRFIELAAILPGETVLDMGCGTGALAIPLAQAGHRVIAADFSRGMLDALESERVQCGVSTPVEAAPGQGSIEQRTLAWSDDWATEGLVANSVDIALASRSIATSNLKMALSKLTDVARRRACITLTRDLSPRIDNRIFEAIGLAPRMGCDFIYAFNILIGMGYAPEVSYIDSARNEHFASFDEALEVFEPLVAKTLRMIPNELSYEEAIDALKRWLHDNLVSDGSSLTLKTPGYSHWVFIAWNTAE